MAESIRHLHGAARTRNLLHEGSLVTRGLKYTLRTEAMPLASRANLKLPGSEKGRSSGTQLTRRSRVYDY